MRVGTGLAIAALLTSVTACGSGGGDTTVAGYVQVFGDPTGSKGQPCDTSQASSDYKDIESGAQVVVKNSDGKQVGIGELSKGQTDGTFGCRFAFKVTSVDSDESYSVQVAEQQPKAVPSSDAGNVKFVLGY